MSTALPCLSKSELIAMLPTNRDLNATLLMAPGVHPSGPAGAYSINGAMSFESIRTRASEPRSTARTRFPLES